MCEIEVVEMWQLLLMACSCVRRVGHTKKVWDTVGEKREYWKRAVAEAPSPESCKGHVSVH